MSLKKAPKVIAACLCSLSLIGSLAGGVMAAEPDIVFKQTLTASNPNIFDYTMNSRTYEYSVTPVTDADVLSVKASDIAVSAGAEGGLTLTTPSVAFDNIVVPAQTDDYSVSKDITLDLNIDKFSAPGVYRYELSNDTTGDSRYADIYLINGLIGLEFESCIFYEADSFAAGNMNKSTSFIDTVSIDQENETFVYTAIFRFEDEQGNTLVEDIVFTETRTQPAKEQLIFKAAARRDIVFNEVVDSVDSALTQYNLVLTSFKEQSYTVISDDVAAHPEGESWFGDDPATPMVYHIVLKAPVPTATPTPSSDTPKTGDSPMIFIYLAVGGVSVIALIGACVIIKNKTSKSKNNRED